MADHGRGLVFGRRTVRDGRRGDLVSAGDDRRRGAVGRVAAAAVQGQPVFVDAETLADRQATCETCEHLTHSRCKLCGCFYLAKIRLATKACPIGKWQRINPEPKTSSANDGEIPDENHVDDDQVDDDDPTNDDLVEAIDIETQKRLWLRAIVPVLQLELPDASTSPSCVATAATRMKTAAYDRVSRLLRSDMIDDRSA